MDDGNPTYQLADIKRLEEGSRFVSDHQEEWTAAIMKCLHTRLTSQDEDKLVMLHAITILATHGWERSADSSFGHEALEFVTMRFQTPLEEAGVDVHAIQDQWDDMVDHAKMYFDLAGQDYKEVWWKLFRSVDAKNWSDMLAVAELLFCIPVANGHLERIFSQMKLIKTSLRSSLDGDSLDDLLRINVEGPPLGEWNAATAVNSWWTEKSRRSGGKEKHCRCTTSSPASATEPEQPKPKSLALDDWESWISQ